MDWIVSADKDIAGNKDQLQARRSYISEVTGSKASNWESFSISRKLSNNFLRCTSLEGVDGVMITAHTHYIYLLSTLKWIAEKPLLIANACVWEVGSDKRLLSFLQKVNPDIELRFAKQSLLFDSKYVPRQYVDLTDVGAFGFKTSRSERDLFRYCSQIGFRPALEKAFHQVCPTPPPVSPEVQMQ